MPEKERNAFELRIAEDKELASKVKEAETVNEAIYYGSLSEFKKTIGQDIKKIKYKPGFNWRKGTYISLASLILISGITTTYTILKDKGQENVKSKDSILYSDSAKTSAAEKDHPVSDKKIIEEKIIPYTTSAIPSDIKDTGNLKYIPPVESGSNTHPVQQNMGQTNPVASDHKRVTDNQNILGNSETTSLKDAPIACDRSFKVNTLPSCKQQETGSIEIVSDGTKEYTFTVDNASIKGAKGLFQNLSPGEHEILVTYNKECSYSKKIIVSEKWCPMNKAYSFNPDYNEKWTFNYETGASGSFKILDRGGKEVYSAIFGTGNEQWNGSDMHGTIVPLGVYVAMISYNDGRQERVELTIVR
jgi:hypothetical protein